MASCLTYFSVWQVVECRDLPTVDRDVDCLGERGSDAILRRASVSPFRLLADGYYGQRPVGELMKGEAHR